MESPYDVLRIDSTADEAEIRRAYRRRVKEAHPDHGGSMRQFQRVKAAYERLTAEGPPGDVDVDLDPEPESDEDEGARVQYLNYEVLADRGWSLDDEDLFEKASDGGLDHEDYGRFVVEPRESLLEAAENRGFAWPYACRGGACANCAVAVTDGEMSQPVNHVLPPEMVERGIRLSCVGTPTTDELRVVFNVKHLPDLDDLRLPPHPFEKTHPRE